MLRTPKSRALAVTLASAGVLSAILLPAGAASAMNPCASDNPPDYCFAPLPPTVAPKPSAPTGLTLTSVLQTSVTLQWTDTSTNETHWRVQRDMVVGNTSTTTYFQPSSTTTTTTGTASWTDTSVTPDASVYYRVQAVNASTAYDVASYSSQLGPMSGRTKSKPANAFGAITGINAAGGRVTVSGYAYDWDTTGPVQVQVWQDGVAQTLVTANGSLYSSPYTFPGGFNATNPGYGDNHGFTATMPSSAVKGTHQVCAQPVDVGGGTPSAQSCTTYQVYGPPSAATNVAATIGTNLVTVTFKDNANDETSWYLQRSTDAQASWLQVGSAYSPITGTGGTGTAYDYSTPPTGTCYRILMVNSYGSTASAAVCPA